MAKTRKKAKKQIGEPLEKDQTLPQIQTRKRKTSDVTEDGAIHKKQPVENLEQNEGKYISCRLEDSLEDQKKNNHGFRYGNRLDEDFKNRIVSPVSDSEDALLVMLENENLVLQGTAEVRVLHGSVDILGYSLTKSEQFTRVFSPSSSSLLTMLNINSGSLSSKGKLSSDLESITNTTARKQVQKICKTCKHASVIQLKSFKSRRLNFVTSYAPFQNLLHPTSKTGDNDAHVIGNTGVTIVTDPGASKFTVSEDYQFVRESLLKMLQEDDKPPVIAICGGKNVGKSTMCRFLVNTLLNHVSEVAFLECDVGQTEFTPSGCVSLTVVKKPLLGPPFTHLIQPTVCQFYGLLSPADDPGFYMECVQESYEHHHSELSHLPLIVNTMGWNKGLGIHLLIDTLRTVRPGALVQIDVSRQAHNLPSMRSQFVNTTPGWTTAMPAEGESAVDYQFAIISSSVTKQNEHHEKLKAADHRHLSLLSYFGSVSVQRSLSACSPYMVPWSSLGVYISHCVVPQTQLLCALNASIVALYRVSEDMMCRSDVEDYPRLLKKQPKKGCIGFGLIRGIDPVKKVFYIVTPVLRHELTEVNALVRGALDMPPQLLLKQRTGGAVPPYVDFTQDISGGGGVRVNRRSMVRHYKSLPERGDV